jgi:hypothetical protein
MECQSRYIEKLKEIQLLADAAQSSLETRTNIGRIQANATTRSGLVLLCGYLEGYIRELLTELTEKINDANPPIDNLAPRLILSAVEDEIVKLRDGREANTFLEISRNTRPISLNHRKLAKTGGNPTVDTIEGLLACFGIPSAVDILSIRDFGIESTFVQESQISDRMRQKIRSIVEPHAGSNTPSALAEIVEVLEQCWNSKIKRRSVGYVGGIEELLKRRNRIAHGESDEPVTPSELGAAIELVSGLIAGLADLAEAQLNILLGTPQE